MATKLFLRNTKNHDTNVAGRFDLSTTAGAGLVTGVTNTTAGGTDIQWTDTGGGQILEWMSPPLSAGFTLATTDTITFNLWGLESSMNANAGVRVRLYRWNRFSGPFGAPMAGAPWDKGTELGTTAAVQNYTGTVTSNVVFNIDDRIVLRVFVTNIGTMGGGFTCTLDYNAGTGGADGDSWIQLTNTVSFLTETPVDVMQRFPQRPPLGSIPQAGHHLCPDFAWLADGGVIHNGISPDRRRNRHGKIYCADGSGTDGTMETIQKTPGGIRFRAARDRVVFPDRDIFLPSTTLSGVTLVMGVRRNISDALTGIFATWFIEGDATDGTPGLGVTDTGVSDSIWVFTLGSRGKEIWKDGVLQASNGTSITSFNSFCVVYNSGVIQWRHAAGAPGNTQVRIGASTGEWADDVTIGLCYIYYRQLAPSAIIEVSRTPFTMFPTPGRLRVRTKTIIADLLQWLHFTEQPSQHWRDDWKKVDT